LVVELGSALPDPTRGLSHPADESAGHVFVLERQHYKRCLFKYDGFRCLVRKVGSRVELISRNGKPLNRSFPDAVAAVERLPGSFVWDAELTVDEPTGQSSFERL
jgi:ATP-dependent DNA ligase